MRSPWRWLRQAGGAFGLLAPKTREQSRARTSLKLVALPAPNFPPTDPLRKAAQDLVQALNDYLANADKRWDRRYRGLGKESFFDLFAIPFARARSAYCQAAMASADPFHEHLATLLERNVWPYWVRHTTDRPAIRILDNWLREEPRIETQPATQWVAQTSVIVPFARGRPTSSYEATLSLEVTQSLPKQSVLCIDVGTEVSIATLALVPERKAHDPSAHLIWKQSRIWVIVADRRLKEGDRMNITLSSAKPIAQSPKVQIGEVAASRPADSAHFLANAGDRSGPPDRDRPM